MKNITQKAVQSFTATALVLACSSMSYAAPLTDSGDHLIISPSTPASPDMQLLEFSTIVADTSFDASWSSPALSPWIGTFSATGSNTHGTTGLVDTRMDFTAMPYGVLAIGTYFGFGDLDTGSGSESFVLRAFNQDNQLISLPWLSTVIGVDGIGSSNGEPGLLDMPSWAWDSVSGEYEFHGNSELSNPSTGVWLSSLEAISYLEVERTSNAAGLFLGAPVPTPGTASLIALGSMVMTRRRRA